MRSWTYSFGTLLVAFALLLGPVSTAWAAGPAAAGVASVDPIQAIVRCVMKSQGGNWQVFLLFNGLENLKARSPQFATWWQESGLKVEDAGAAQKVINWWKENDPFGSTDKDRGMRHLIGAAWSALGSCTGDTKTEAKAAIAPAGVLVETCLQCKNRTGNCWYCYPTPCLTCP